MRVLLCALLLSTCVFAFGDTDIPLQNWPVPAASPSHGRIATNTNGTSFVGITPCRLVDTRYFSGPFGQPIYSAGQARTYDVSTGPCADIPVAAVYSLNFTIVSYDVNAANPYIVAYPAGGQLPGVSTVNFGTGLPVANAALIASGLNGQITVYAGGQTHIIIDINGYFIGAANTFPTGKVFQQNGNVANGGVISGRNDTTTAGVYTSGVLGTLTAVNLTDGSGVMGYVATGNTWGVKGFHTGNYYDSGGVLGIQGGARPVAATQVGAGVRGEALIGLGVLGMSGGVNGAGGRFTHLDAQGVVLRGVYLATNSHALYAQGNTEATGTKSFIDPHPTDPTKVIRFVSLEGPEAGTYFRGRGRFVRGRAVIEVPEAFRFTTEEEGLTVHLTPIGGLAMVAVTKQSLERIEAEASKDVEFSYVVYGVRRGYKDFEPIAPGTEFMPDTPAATLPAYLNDEQKKRLIGNGTYNTDGTVNLDTAVRLGWEKAWAERDNRR